MEKKNLIGKKVKGFKFSTSSELAYTSNMDGYEECAGEIIGVDEVSVKVQFEDGKHYWYPLDQIEQHLVEEERPSQYEVGMTVYDLRHEGGGKIIYIDDSDMYPVGVDFGGDISTYTKNGRNTIHARCTLLSLTPYDLVNGGATFPTFKPKLPDIEKGTLVYVRPECGNEWRMRYFSHFDDKGVIHCFSDQNKDGFTGSWPEYSLTNPLIEEK